MDRDRCGAHRPAGADAAAYAIADNRTGELAEWDQDVLQFELDRLGISELTAMFEIPDQEEEPEPFEVGSKEAIGKTVWMVCLMPDRDSAERVRVEAEVIGGKVAIGERRQQ